MRLRREDEIDGRRKIPGDNDRLDIIGQAPLQRFPPQPRPDKDTRAARVKGRLQVVELVANERGLRGDRTRVRLPDHSRPRLETGVLGRTRTAQDDIDLAAPCSEPGLQGGVDAVELPAAHDTPRDFRLTGADRDLDSGCGEPGDCFRCSFHEGQGRQNFSRSSIG